MKIPECIYDLTLSPVEYQRNLRHWSREMRETTPIIWDEESANWLVFRYADVSRVQSDYQVFSSEHTIIKPVDTHGSPSLIEMDPPRHQQMRSLITQAFSARTIAALEPQITRTVDELLDTLLTRGSGDWMTSLANPLPVIVIARMLGLPAEEWSQFKTWTDALVNRSAEHEQAHEHFLRHFRQAIDQRHREPGTDILSQLSVAEIDGRRLSDDDLISFCFTLFIAGNITTTNVLGNLLLCFAQYPEELERLRRQPELATSAVEEVLRYMPPFRAGPNDLVAGRVAKCDVTLCGQLVRAGEQVQVNRISANFDERQFPDPERFDVGRSPNRHQSFGHGIHFCLGAPLARLETRVVLERMLKKFRAIHIASDAPLRQIPSSIIFGPQSLPVTFQAAWR